MSQSVIPAPILENKLFSNDFIVDINTTNVENVYSRVTVNGCIAYVYLGFRMKVSVSGSAGLPIGKLNSKYKYAGSRPIIPLVNYNNGDDIVPSVWVNQPENTINVQSVNAGNDYIAVFTIILEKPL